jgi:hypothetical protein
LRLLPCRRHLNSRRGRVNLRDGIPVQCESIPHPFCASAPDARHLRRRIPWLRACARRNGIAIEPVGR